MSPANDVDSETEVFSDTYDHIAQSDEVPVASAQNGVDANDIMLLRGGSDNVINKFPPNRSSNRTLSSLRPNTPRDLNLMPGPSGANAVGGAGSGGIGPNQRDNIVAINEQLALSVLRLHQSMEQVVTRLNALESSLGNPRNGVSSRKPNWWPFGNTSPQLVFLLVAWPFVAHWIVYRIQKRRSN